MGGQGAWEGYRRRRRRRTPAAPKLLAGWWGVPVVIPYPCLSVPVVIPFPSCRWFSRVEICADPCRFEAKILRSQKGRLSVLCAPRPEVRSMAQLAAPHGGGLRTYTGWGGRRRRGGRPGSADGTASESCLGWGGVWGGAGGDAGLIGTQDISGG